MTLKLILMRHGKSDWHAGTNDFERPLNPRGKRASPVMGQWLQNLGHIPDEILCSTATRTRQTCELTGLKAAPHTLDTLYLAEPETLLDALRGASGGCVMMVGHNPGFARFAELMMREDVQHKDFNRFPTCATLVVEFASDTWKDSGPGTGRALNFAVPKDLGVSKTP